MSGPLDSTFGVWFVCLWVQTILLGCGLLQAFLYFHWYEKDRWALKAMVALLAVIETIGSILYFQVTHSYLIDHFGDTANLFKIYWQDSAQLFATYLSAFVVHAYFAHCIYVSDKSRRKLVVIILLLAFIAFGSGLAQTILTLRLHHFTELSTTKPVTTLQAAATLSCDILITITLVSTLDKHKGEITRTNDALSSLMVIAVNRGSLTALCAALNMILFLAKPNTYYFLIGLELSGKLYMNSALATLNSRKHIVASSFGSEEVTNRSSMQWRAFTMSTIVHDTRSVVAHDELPPVHIYVEQQVRMESDQDVKKSQLLGDIVA